MLPAQVTSSAEIAASLAQIMGSLEELANKCRDQGTDAVSMIISMMTGRVGQNDKRLVAEPQAVALDDAELTSRSHDFIDALGRGDVAAVATELAPGFVHFASGIAIDRDAMLTAIIRRTSKVPDVASRTWDNESVIRKGDALVFTGKAHEIQGGNETHGGYVRDGWYLLQWVCTGDAWRVQLLTWQSELTARDWWNNTFQKGRGFSREPNRLLVETVADEKPGAVLELAMGQGRNALYLAAHGWKVTGVDLSDEGLGIAREEAARRGLELETINADLDEWHFGVDCFDLVTWIYAADHAKWIDKIKTSLRAGGLFVVEGWAKVSADNPVGFDEAELLKLFDDYEILRDEIVEDVPDWACDKGKLVRFVARKRAH